MKTLKKVEIVPIWVDEIPGTLKQGLFYISLKYMTASHLCLCGCGKLSVTPLAKDGWSLEMQKITGDKITITPSILNNNCPNKSHYIITKNVANFV